MNESADIRVLHYIFSYLPTTCNWIYPQLTKVPHSMGSVLTHEVENRDEFPFECIEICPTRPVTRLRSLELKQKLEFTRRMSAKVSEVGPDVVHAHFGREGACIARVARSLDVPLVTSFYGMDLALAKYRWWRRRYDYLFKYGERFICEGPFAMKQLVGLGCPEEKCRVVRLGVDLAATSYKKRSGSGPGRPRILMASSFREKKGVSYGIRAFAACASDHPESEMVIIGDGPLRGEVESTIRECGIGSRVKLLGYQPYAAFFEWLFESDIFLAPSITAEDGDTEGGSPVSIAEASASGIPVISSWHADIPEVVQHERTGFLSPERDVESLASHMSRLLGSKELRDTLGRCAREHMEQKFDRQKELCDLSDMYDELKSQ